jgi:hypothetical protein
LKGKPILSACVTTACGLSRNGGIQNYAGLCGRESLATIGLGKLRAAVQDRVPASVLGDNSGRILDLRISDCNRKLVPRGTAASQDASHQEPVKSHGISMQKVANAREHHRQIQAVRGGNYIRVTNRASGLDHGSRACFRRLLDSIGKGEKRIGSHDASLQ